MRRKTGRRRFRSGWLLPGLRAGLFAAFFSGIALYLCLLLFFGHLFTTTYDYMLAPILFVSHLSLVFGALGLGVGLFWRGVYKVTRLRVRGDDPLALCMSSCLAGAGAFFAGAWVAFGAFPGQDAATVVGLLAVVVLASAAVWVLYRPALRRTLVALMPSSRWAVALIILSAFGTVLGSSVRSEHMTDRPQHFVDVAPRGGPGSGVQPGSGRAPVEGASDAEGASLGSRLNLLLLTVDTLRADHLGCYGYKRATSPAVDSLAASGVLFDRAYAHRPKTSPNFASILTGTYPQRHGVRRTRQALPASAYTLAEALRDAGYSTCGVVTNGNLFPAFGFDQGFETYLYGHSGARRGSEIALEWVREYVSGSETALEGGAGETSVGSGADWAEGRSGSSQAESARPQGRGEAPFALWVHHTDPHTLYKPPAPYDNIFAKEVEYGMHALEVARHGGLGGVKPGLIIEGPLDLDYYISQYDGEIAYTDRWIGELLEGLRALGLESNTLVVFTADHGESLGEHGYFFEHGLFPYEPSARIPLVFSLPGRMGAGVVESVTVESAALMPTILELLGIESPPTCQGESLVEIVPSLTDPGAGGSAKEAGSRGSDPGTSSDEGGDRRARDPLSGENSAYEPGRLAYIEAGYGHHFGPGYTFAITDGRYKLVLRDISWVVRPRHIKRFIYSLNALFEGGAEDHELYDLESDPREVRNVIDELPEVAAALRAEMTAFLDRMMEEGALPPDGEERDVDEETLRALRALGYVH